MNVEKLSKEELLDKRLEEARDSLSAICEELQVNFLGAFSAVDFKEREDSFDMEGASTAFWHSCLPNSDEVPEEESRKVHIKRKAIASTLVGAIEGHTIFKQAKIESLITKFGK